MADNEGNFTDDDAYEEFDDNYGRVQVNDEDENDEGTIEYLDLDFEAETFEEYCPEVISRETTKPGVVQSSLLKTSYEPMQPKTAAKYKPILIKPPVIIPTRSIMRTRSSTENSAKRNSAKRTADCLVSATVHDAVNNINAKLANSVKSVNGRGTKRTLMNNGDAEETPVQSSGKDSLKIEKKSDLDSLDLFFQSMAQTVLNLPSQVQAKIKMDICKVIAMAEIKYGPSDAVRGVGKA